MLKQLCSNRLDDETLSHVATNTYLSGLFHNPGPTQYLYLHSS